MKRIKTISVIALLALVAAACGDGDAETTTTPGETTTTAAETTTTAGGEDTTTTTEAMADGPLAEFGESTEADPALIEKALGPVEPSDEASWNIVLASIAR
ncbi:MAG TPA: hypothetical protein VMS74_12540, partial [Acidimicrobiia bacterium]|nr:hypothetical protein [Acidimicrobiia bacterium]